MARAAAQLTGNAIERIRAEKALSEAAKRLSLAERVARFGIWEADFAKRVMNISGGMAAIMELPPDTRSLTSRQFDAMVHPDDLRALLAAVETMSVDGYIVQNEFRLMLPSGDVRWFRSHWRAESGDASQKQAIGAMIDITEEMNMLVQAQEAGAAAEDSARVARQAERLEQDRKTILEMVAKDQPLDQIVTTMATAVSSHFPGSLCAIRIELSDASRISVYPEFPDSLAKALDRIVVRRLPLVHETSSPPAHRGAFERPGVALFHRDMRGHSLFPVSSRAHSS